MATGFPTKANYVAGDILTAANMNDLSGTVNYLQYAKTQNPILNSQFNVWQRGATGAGATGSTTGFIADRWQVGRAGFVAGLTCSRQATGDTTNLPNIQYCSRVQRDSGNTSTANLFLTQSFESINSISFAGKAVTLSFYARAGANYSATSNALSVSVQSGTGTDQNFYTAGYTGNATPVSGTATLTTTWQRFTFSGTVASTATELAVQFSETPTGTAGANDYFEITGVQLELGSVANTYQPNGATYQAELAACQRYYYRTGALVSGGGAYTAVGQASAYATTGIYCLIQLPSTMRVKPSTIEWSGLQFSDGVNAGIVPTAINYDGSSNVNMAVINSAVTGATVYRPYQLTGANNAQSYIGFSAEL